MPSPSLPLTHRRPVSVSLLRLLACLLGAVGVLQFIYRNFILPRRVARHRGFALPPPNDGWWFPGLGHLLLVLRNRDIDDMDHHIAELNDGYRALCRERGYHPGSAGSPGNHTEVTKASVVGEFFERYPGIQVEVAQRSFIFPLSPEDIRHVTQGNFKNYVMGELRVEVVSEFMGHGIFTSDGEFWRDQRNLAKPSFQNHSLELMLPAFHHHAQTLVEHVDVALLAGRHQGQSLDVQALFLCFTLDCSGEILFNHSIGSLRGIIPFQRAFDYLQVETEKRITNPLWKILPAPKYHQCLQICNNFVDKIIVAAREDPNLAERNDLLARFMTSPNEYGQPRTLDNKYLRDMLMNFLIAARDTTAVTLTWLFYELASNPVVQEKVYKEIVTLFPNSHPTTLEEIRSLKYLKDTINETLRLHPPVPRVLRCAQEDDLLPSGYTVKANTNVLYQPYILHRLEALWGEDCLIFDPDRWSDERTKSIGTYEFLPFHGGPRRCLGFDLAYNEVKMATFVLLQNFSVTLDPSVKVKHLSAITLAAENGVKIFFTRREKTAAK